MDDATRTVIRAGASGSLIEDFRTLAQATAPDGGPRYAPEPVLAWLARFLVGGAGGPNKDTPIYELCHLANAVDAAGKTRDRLSIFFMCPGRASPAIFRARLEKAVAAGGWRRTGFEQTKEGVTIRYRDGQFTIRFGRMPFLAALYEFLAGMEGFAFYAELNDILAEMAAAPHEIKSVQAASNRIASRLREYRRRNLARARHDGKFDTILGFLKARSDADRINIDDSDLLEFWVAKSGGEDYRAYRTVFDSFVNFMRALEEAARAEGIEGAAAIGTDREAGEIEPDDSAGTPDETGEWTSPLALLDCPPASAIKFFKKESERKPMELLLHYGPAASRLPLAFLRLESFGPVQSAITTDLQVGRGRESISRRIACDDAAPYPRIVEKLGALAGLVGRLEKAALYALHKQGMASGSPPGRGASVIALRPTNSANLFEQARDRVEAGEEFDAESLAQARRDAEKAFRSFARKGFDEKDLGRDDRIEGFRVGAAALLAIDAQLAAYLKAAASVERREKNLSACFDQDRAVFSERFRALYGAKA
jgi:hypothetical protein